jgi:beta-phosphoglucomutase
MIGAVLFDMDGVLVDSEPFICKAAIMMFSELGTTVKENDFQPFIGMGENRYLGGVAELHGIIVNIEEAKERTYKIYSEIVRGVITPLPGAVSFVATCRKRGLKLSLATSADRVKVDVNLREIGLPAGSFDSIITGLDVRNKKPYPDIYLKAAESLDINPENCLVVEDAVSGIQAGKKAGCKCLGVTTSFDASALKDADWIVDSLSNVPEEVLNW